jgi:hypothetical protein
VQLARLDFEIPDTHQLPQAMHVHDGGVLQRRRHDNRPLAELVLTDQAA